MVTTVSAPGKALVAGGYLVLDPTYFGVVFATDARFYTSVASFPQRDTPRIRVRSPQFLEAEWVYDVVLPAMGSEDELTEGLQLVQVDENGKNPFVALTLLYALHLGIETLGDALRSQLGGGLDIVIAGDNDYYSHRVEVRNCANTGTSAAARAAPGPAALCAAALHAEQRAQDRPRLERGDDHVAHRRRALAPRHCQGRERGRGDAARVPRPDPQHGTARALRGPRQGRLGL